MGTVFENMAECVNNSSGEVILSSSLSRVWSDGQKVTKISVENEDGNETEYSCDALINTIPLTYLASALDAGNSSIRIESAHDLNFNKQLENVIESLSKTKNLYTVGRHGLFLNNDIHDSMEMGIKIATNLLEKEDVVSWYNFALGYVRGKINRTRI